MSDSRSPRPVATPVLVGEAYGRIEVPLPGLPEGVVALTVPRTGADGERIPLDRKGRIRVTAVDLVARDPVDAYAPPSTLSRAELAWILETGTRRWLTIETKFGERTRSIAFDLVRAGAVVLRCDVNVLTFTPRSWRLTYAWSTQADDLLQELRGRVAPDLARSELLAIMNGVPQLIDEHSHLLAMSHGSPLRVPDASRTRTNAWPVYEAAVRAASIWWPAQGQGKRRQTMKELAGKALGGSKKWTPARQVAFANLIDLPFDQALDKADYEVRVRGPLQWWVGTVAADASTAQAWIGLPTGGIHIVGRIERNAVGVLVIENSDTFQQVCLRKDITDTWLCVWGKGSVADGIVAFLKTMTDLPIAIWCDLDAYGIRIVDSLASRLGRCITPVAMTVDLYTAGTKYRPEDLSESQRVATNMAEEGPESLRDLARAIVASNGWGCEQETLYDEVLDVLAKELSEIQI